MDTIDIQIVTDKKVPDTSALKRWCLSALADDKRDAELTLRIVDAEEMQHLNATYRGKDKPTNVLSFPSELPEEIGIAMLGDIVICAGVVEHEAAEQNKSSDAHWAHMVVHGTLHLQGYDHIHDDDAEKMEALETDILTDLGFPAPYNIHSPTP